MANEGPEIDKEYEKAANLSGSEDVESPVEPLDKELGAGKEDGGRIKSTKTQNDQEHGDEAELTKTKSIAERMSPLHEFMFVAVVCQAQLTTQAGLGQGLSILSDIGRHYDLPFADLSWFLAGYSLTVGTFILIWGRFGDLFGHKKMLLIGFGWFGIWSMAAGFAYWSNHVLFVFCRVFQGIGPSIMLPNAIAIFGSTYNPGKRKAMVFSIFGACAPNGSILGSAFAALFALTWYPWAFISLGIWLLVLIVIGYFVIPDCPNSAHFAKPGKRTLKETVTELDPLGAITGVLALVLFNFAWNQAPMVGWQKAYVIVTLVLGLLLFPVFIYIELHVASAPLIPFKTLTSDVVFVLACISCGWAAFGVWSYYSFAILEVIRGASPLLATAYISPVGVSGACAAIATGILLGKVKPAWVMLGAMIAFTVGTVLLMTAPVHQIYWGQFFFTSVVTPWGMDMSFPAGTLILSNLLPKKHQGVAASLVNTVVNYSISLGLGFAGTVEVHVNNGGKTQDDILKGFRGALYMGCGLAGLGVAVAVIFVIKSYTSKAAKEERRQSSPERSDDEKAA